MLQNLSSVKNRFVNLAHSSSRASLLSHEARAQHSLVKDHGHPTQRNCINCLTVRFLDFKQPKTYGICSLETKQLLRRSGPGWKVASFDASAFPPEVPVFFQTQPIDLAASDLSSLSRQAD
ncbi:hypothetical protein LINPERHAP1_LOCUS9746 [Linum perenne]